MFEKLTGVWGGRYQQDPSFRANQMQRVLGPERNPVQDFEAARRRCRDSRQPERGGPALLQQEQDAAQECHDKKDRREWLNYVHTFTARY
jgi:hypothetical protein